MKTSNRTTSNICPPRDRSPHPYLYHTDALRALRTASPPPNTTTPTTDNRNTADNAFPPPSSSHHFYPTNPTARSPSRPRRRRRPRAQRSSTATTTTSTTAPSSSGTEADDEAAAVGVRALPAPFLRPRKGLRGASAEDAGPALEELDQLLSPGGADDQGTRAREQVGGKGKGEGKGGLGRGQEVNGRWEEFRRKRRAELGRRVSETVLLAGMGIVVGCGRGVWERGWGWHRERALDEGGPRRYGIRVPSAFDPATLLYPAFLPVFVAMSLSSTAGELILPNVVLGLSALPTRLIFKFGNPAGYDCLHWFLSMIPLFASQWTAWPSKLFPLKPYGLKAPPPAGLDPETIICLFPLQWALTQPLRFLTTTSLLPAELQLLATALINLYLFARSPQAKILSALLLPGGILLFVFCRHVLQWNVALARIPKWRLRRAGRIIMARDSFLDILTAGLRSQGIPTPFPTPIGKDQGSDADEDGHLLDRAKDKPSKPRLRALTTQFNSSVKHDDGTRSAIEPPTQSSIPTNANGFGHTIPQTSPRKRRYTMSNVSELQSSPSADLPGSPAIKGSRRQRSNSLVHSYLSLTPLEAKARRWFYAGFTYIVVLLIILIPLRTLIGRQALNGCEPFGWALGYLFGDIETFRTFVLHYHLETWIPLPPFTQPTFELRALLDLHFLSAHPISTLRTALGAPTTRLLLTTHWLLTLTAGLTTVLLLPRLTHIEVDTRRKIFHGTVVALLLPTIPFDPAFAALTLSLVLAVFLLLDLLRAAQVPPIATPLARFLTPYVDGRDLRGPVVVSHMFLLIGCAIPLWLSLAGSGRSGEEGPWRGWEVEHREVGMVAGVVCVGMGDAAASLVGRRFGRRKWPWTGGKSLEGSAAFAGAVTAGLLFSKFWLRYGGWEEGEGQAAAGELEGWPMVVMKSVLAACGSSFMEAVLTGGNDNVVVPVALWLLVRGLRL
ncbi:MAG: hypothetical protein M1821_001057 [Bathelium mastoideum]|nr:MAG: hypothetical protein M1821_001057 [Bathelium mastoideum]